MITRGLLKGFRRIPWGEISAIGILVMDLCWIAMAYRILSQIGRTSSLPWVSMVLGSILLAAYVSTRIMAALNLGVWIRRGLTFVLLTFSWLFALKQLLFRATLLKLGLLFNHIASAFIDPTQIFLAMFLMLFFVLLIWWRGSASAHRWINARNVVHNFQFGAFVFLVMGLLPEGPWNEDILRMFYLFTFSALIAVSTGRAEELSNLHGSRRYALDHNWLMAIVLGVTIAIVSAAVAAGFASEYLEAVIAGLFVIIAKVVLILLLLLLSPILLIVLMLLPELLSKIQIALDWPAVYDILIGVFQILLDVRNGLFVFFTRFRDRIPDTREIIPFLILGAGLGTVVLFIFLIGRWKRLPRDYRLAPDLEREAIDWEGLKNLLREVLARRAQQFAAGLDRITPSGRILGAVRIRRIYAQLMRMCAQMDRPRHRAQTPNEFLPTIQKLFPDRADDVARITQAYVRVRYGELPETRQEILDVDAAWDNVRTAWQATRRERKARRKA